MRNYEYQGETFEISKPEGCEVEVRGKGESGHVRLDEATRNFYAYILGRSTAHPTFKGALDHLCAAILEKEERPSMEALCKEMDEFYDNRP